MGPRKFKNINYMITLSGIHLIIILFLFFLEFLEAIFSQILRYNNGFERLKFLANYMKLFLIQKVFVAFKMFYYEQLSYFQNNRSFLSKKDFDKVKYKYF